jgi:hypothetical protein
MGEKIFWCDGIRYVLADGFIFVFYKIFWCEEIVCYGYGRNRTGDLFFVRYVLADRFIFVFYKIFWCGGVSPKSPLFA